MNREERRRKRKPVDVGQLLRDMTAANQFKDIIEGDWPIHEGDKVRLNLEAITKHPDYDRKLPGYRKFVEENAGRVFTVGLCANINPSVVYLKEDQTWLFWIGDLEKIQDSDT